jgi:hypothetical protein
MSALAWSPGKLLAHDEVFARPFPHPPQGDAGRRSYAGSTVSGNVAGSRAAFSRSSIRTTHSTARAKRSTGGGWLRVLRQGEALLERRVPAGLGTPGDGAFGALLPHHVKGGTQALPFEVRPHASDSHNDVLDVDVRLHGHLTRTASRTPGRGRGVSIDTRGSPIRRATHA